MWMPGVVIQLVVGRSAFLKGWQAVAHKTAHPATCIHGLTIDSKQFAIHVDACDYSCFERLFVSKGVYGFENRLEPYVWSSINTGRHSTVANNGSSKDWLAATHCIEIKMIHRTANHIVLVSRLTSPLHHCWVTWSIAPGGSIFPKLQLQHTNKLRFCASKHWFAFLVQSPLELTFNSSLDTYGRWTNPYNNTTTVLS